MPDQSQNSLRDDDLLRAIISMSLEPHGFQVRIARNGAEGVKIALEWLPDLILMELIRVHS